MSDNSVRSIIVEAMARALFVSAYADAAEEADRDDLSPGPRGDWMDVAPETRDDAKEKAIEVVARIEKDNSITIEEAYAKAEAAEGHRKPPTPEDFGHYLGMQALGHGVSWMDDHPDHDLEVPYIEYYLDAEDLPAQD